MVLKLSFAEPGRLYLILKNPRLCEYLDRVIGAAKVIKYAAFQHRCKLIEGNSKYAMIPHAVGDAIQPKHERLCTTKSDNGAISGEDMFHFMRYGTLDATSEGS